MQESDKKISIIKEVIENNYVKAQLKTFYEHFLVKFLEKNISLSHKYPESLYLIHNPKENKKHAYVEVWSAFFYYEELFKALLNSELAPIKELTEALIWEEQFTDEEILEKFDLDIIDHDYSGRQPYQEVQSLYYLFSISSKSSYIYAPYRRNNPYKPRHKHHLSLDVSLKKVLKAYVETPREYHILPISEELVKKDCPYLYQSVHPIFSELTLCQSYQKKDLIKVLKSGRVNASTLNKMRRYCQLTEFYPEKASSDKDLINLRTRFLAELVLYLAKFKSTEVKSPLENLRFFLDLFKKAKFKSPRLLPHLKGWYHVSFNLNCNGQFIELLQELPLSEWVNLEDIFKYLQYHNYAFDIASPQEVKYYLYFEKKALISKYRYQDKEYIDKHNYSSMVQKPLLQNFIAFFASIGLLDIAYDLPKPDESPTILGAGIKYFRVNNLGAHLLGKLPEYTPPQLNEEPVELDKDNLFIYYAGTNKSLTITLESISRPLGKNLYKFDFESVLGSCNNQDEVNANIQIFKQLLSENLPKIWKDFFEALQKKAYKLYNQNAEYLLYQLPQNEELIALMAKDEFLKKNVIRAEYYNILIPRNKIKKVKNHLKKAGFLIEFE